MKSWKIENLISGVCLGIYQAETAESALDKMAREAGYDDYATLQKVVPVEDHEISCKAFCKNCHIFDRHTIDDSGYCEYCRRELKEKRNDTQTRTS